ncbi:MAG: hypothetical protein Q9166_000797 [cf. Caloplaca sp. 2 TL-2023]
MSNGSVATLNTILPTRSALIAVHSSMEAWVVAWSSLTEAPSLYTGGDDSALCCRKVEDGGGLFRILPLPPEGIFERDTKTHGAGITAILPLGLDEANREVILTGSYDEQIRILCIAPGAKRAKVLARKGLHGGVWQLKDIEIPRPVNLVFPAKLCFRILASCMFAGCKVLEILRDTNKEWEISVLAEFNYPDILNYASDFRPEPDLQTLMDLTYVSTSFYDKKLCIWRLEGA